MLAHQGRSAASGVINLAWMDLPTGRRTDASMLTLQVEFRPVFAIAKRILHATVKSSPTRLISLLDGQVQVAKRSFPSA